MYLTIKFFSTKMKNKIVELKGPVNEFYLVISYIKCNLERPSMQYIISHYYMICFNTNIILISNEYFSLKR